MVGPGARWEQWRSTGLLRFGLCSTCATSGCCAGAGVGVAQAVSTITASKNKTQQFVQWDLIFHLFSLKIVYLPRHRMEYPFGRNSGHSACLSSLAYSFFLSAECSSSTNSDGSVV